MPPTARPLERVGLACGVVGPTAFVAAWVVGAALRGDAYDPLEQAISQLARTGSAHREVMTAGFVTFGLLVPVYAQVLGRRLGAPGVRAATTVSGLATLAVAALPLSAAGGQGVDTWHAVAAGTGYAGQVLAPLLAARREDGPRWRAAAYAVGGVALACLVGSVTVPGSTGVLQRAGLTVVDAWFAATAVRLAAGR